MDLYAWILLTIPNWVMAVLMSGTAVLCWLRFRRRRRWSIMALFFPLVGAAVFYWWGVLFEPEPLAWIAGGRAMVFGLGVGLLLWLRATAAGGDDG